MRQLHALIIVTAALVAGTAQAGEKITGVAGMKLGADAREYLEFVEENSYRLSNITRHVEDAGTIPLDNFTYAYLVPPKPIDGMIEGADFDYLGLMDDELRLIEVVVDISMSRQCSQTSVPKKFMENLRGRYDLAESNEDTVGTSETYTDGQNELRLRCRGQRISLRYTSHLFDKYVSRLKSEEEESIGDAADQL